MYVVYWMEKEDEASDEGRPMARSFGSEDMKLALDFMETLRQRQRAERTVSHVAMSSERPESVGLMGVADPAPDYSWKKRRR